MTDRNGAPVTIGAKVRFTGDLLGGRWVEGWVRDTGEHTYYHPRRVVWEARVDNGIRDDGDFSTNLATIAAWVVSEDIEVSAWEKYDAIVALRDRLAEAQAAMQDAERRLRDAKYAKDRARLAFEEAEIRLDEAGYDLDDAETDFSEAAAREEELYDQLEALENAP